MRGGGGLGLHVREWGDPHGPPIVFVHGWSQSQLCWSRQIAGALAQDFRIVTFDLRGHGMSEKPLSAERYGDARLWADDLAAVIELVAPERPVLVAWSYGGFVVTDYLRAYGEAGIAGVEPRGWRGACCTPGFEHIGPGLLENAGDACAPDLPTNIAAICRFLRACTAEPLSADDWSAALGWNMVVPPEVRQALLAREIDADDVLSRAVRAGAGDARARRRDRPAVDGRARARCLRDARTPPGTRTSATCRSSRIRSGSTASWASSRGGHLPRAELSGRRPYPAQPSSLIDQPAFQIFVMWLILPSANSIA